MVASDAAAQDRAPGPFPVGALPPLASAAVLHGLAHCDKIARSFVF
jgi:hypothetical protein